MRMHAFPCSLAPVDAGAGLEYVHWPAGLSHSRTRSPDRGRGDEPATVVPSAHVIFFFTPCSAAEKDFLPKALVVGDLTAHGSYISVHSMSALGQEQQSKLNRVCYLPETTAGPLQELLHVSSCPYARIRFLRADQGIASATMQPSSGSSLRWKKSSMHYRNVFFVECLNLFYTRQTFCRVYFISKEIFVEYFFRIPGKEKHSAN
jgi:hypothetical protein